MGTDTDKQRILDIVANITPLDSVAMEQARARQQVLTKPADSLGRLEDLAVQIAGITGQAVPTLERKAVIVMVGDHGVAVEGVSAYPSDVTVQMVSNFLRGGAAINALARHAGAAVLIVDVGVAGKIEEPGLLSWKVAPGTANMASGPAMTEAQMLAAIQVGIDVLNAQAEYLPVVIDGFISGAAALIAAELCPLVCHYLIAGHISVEPGHQLICLKLGLTPLLNLKMRLGEGTGAVLAMNIIEAALRTHREMATFAEAGVSTREEQA